MSKPEAYVFPDTNVFMHYETFDAIDWPALVGSASVVLCVSRTVMSELETKKFDQKVSGRKRERVKKLVIKMDQMLAAGGVVRDRVRLHLARHPSKEDAPADLNLDHPDDAHVAAAHEQQQRGTDVYIVSADTGVRNTSRLLGLKLVDLPERLELPPEPDELEAELRKVKLENEKLKAVKQPKISVRFADGERVARFHLRPMGAMSDAEIMRRAKEHVSKLALTDVAMLGGADHVVKAVVTQYEKRRAHKAQIEASVTLQLTLFNEGEAPAKGVHVSLTFPESLIVEDGLPEEPRDPEKGMQFGAIFGFDTSIGEMQIERPEDWAFAGASVETARASVTHSRHISLPPLYVRPQAATDRDPFVIKGKVVIAEPPSVEEFALRVVLDGRIDVA